MAEMHYTQGMGHDSYDAHDQASASYSNTLKNLTNFAGAAVSLALIAGVSVWGYKLVMRDVSGIPVVRAAEGERPDDDEEAAMVAEARMGARHLLSRLSGHPMGAAHPHLPLRIRQPPGPNRSIRPLRHTGCRP